MASSSRQPALPRDARRYSPYARERFRRAFDTSIRTTQPPPIQHNRPVRPAQPPPPPPPPRLNKRSRDANHPTRAPPPPARRPKTTRRNVASARTPTTPTYFSLLPSDVCERVAAFLASRHDARTLLFLAEAAPCMRASVMHVLRHAVVLDEHTLPNVSRWALLFYVAVRTVVVTRRIRCYDASITLPPLLHLLSAPCLRVATVPAVPRLLALLARSPTLRSLGVFIRNREDAHTLLTAGTPSSAQNGSPPFPQVTALQLHCVAADNGSPEPFCFTTPCAIESLTPHGDGIPCDLGLATRFPHVSHLSIRCFHKMPSEIWPLVTSFPKVTDVSFDTPIDLCEDAIPKLRAMRTVSLSGIRDGARLAASIGTPLIQLCVHERPLSTDDVSALTACPHLVHLSVVLEAGAENALFPIVPNLTTLALRWSYSEIALAILRIHGRSYGTHWHRPDAGLLSDLAKAASRLETLHLELVQVHSDELRDILHCLGGRLSRFVTSLEGQHVTADVRLLTLMSNVVQRCHNLKHVAFHEASEGTEHRYQLDLTKERKSVLQKSLRLFRSRAPLLGMEAIEEAVARMCGSNRFGWT